MEQILALSLSSGNFTAVPINSEEINAQSLFHFSSFVPIAMRLLQIDANLARMHSKLSPKMDEQIFWFHYYCRVLYLRAAIGMDGPDAKVRAASWLKAQPDIIHRLTAPTPTTTSNSSQHFVGNSFFTISIRFSCNFFSSVSNSHSSNINWDSFQSVCRSDFSCSSCYHCAGRIFRERVCGFHSRHEKDAGRPGLRFG